MDTASPSQVGAIRFGVFEVDLRAGELRKQGVKIKLQDQPFQLLQILLERPGEVVTRNEIQRRIWPSDTFVDFEGGVNNAVKRLREALGDGAGNPRYIETLPRKGYRFIGSLNGHVAPAAQVRQVWPKVTLACVASVILVAGTLVSLNIAGLEDRLWPPSPNPQIKSLVVLPFPSLSSDAKDGYFAEGFTDAVTTALARIGSLRVVSRTTAERYPRSGKSSPQIARELTVDGIVEGTVQRSGNRVRITVQLIHGSSDRHVWAESFEADVQNELAVENNIATKIADQIQAKVRAEQQALLKKVRQVNPKALDAYFEARYHLDQASKVVLYYGKKAIGDAEVSKAVSYLDLAVQLDPSYVSAYLAYPDALDEAPSPALLQRTEAALRKALEVDESNERAHIAFANLLMRYEYDWAGAEREIRRAIELNPSSAEAHSQYADYLNNLGGVPDNIGDGPEAKKERDLAQALDPAHDYSAGCCEGLVSFRMAMQVDDERRILEEKAPNNPELLAVLGKEYAMAGRYKESVEMWERNLSVLGWHDFVRVLKRANAQRGPRRALEEWMRAGEEYSKSHDDLPVFVMAFTYTSLGDKDRAFAWLSKAVEQRNWCIVYLKTDTVWDPLRSDPRFMELLHRVGLPT
jgi:TolB-like protein/DNA-binding winged helix-turn-helix (wHTH) protein